MWRYPLFYRGSGLLFFFFFNDTATTEIYTISLHDALLILDGLLTVVLLVDLDYPTDWFRSERVKLHVVEWCFYCDYALRCGAHVRRYYSRWRCRVIGGTRCLLRCCRTGCW